GAQEGPRADAAKAKPAAAAPACVLDRSVLEGLRSLDADEPHVLRQVIGVYLEDTPNLIRQMNDALGASDMPTIVKVAHTLKSASGNVGAADFADLCKQVEAAAQREAHEETRDLMSSVEESF